jgi:hypothetical protein
VEICASRLSSLPRALTTHVSRQHVKQPLSRRRAGISPARADGLIGGVGVLVHNNLRSKLCASPSPFLSSYTMVASATCLAKDATLSALLCSLLPRFAIPPGSGAECRKFLDSSRRQCQPIHPDILRRGHVSHRLGGLEFQLYRLLPSRCQRR